MMTKKLNAHQARWAEFLSHFYFLIKYQPGQQNTLADALSRPLRRQEDADSDHQMQILIKPENIEQAAKEDLSTDIEPLDSDLHIVDWILWANQESSSLDKLQDWAWDNKNEDCSWKLEDGLLLWKDWLFIPDDDPELWTQLLDEVHSQVSTAHLGQTKTQQLVKNCYY